MSIPVSLDMWELLKIYIQSTLDLAEFDLAETLDLADDNLVPSEFLLSKILSI